MHARVRLPCPARAHSPDQHLWGTWSVEVTAGSPLILRRECGAVYPVGVVVNLVAAAGGGNGTRTGWMGVVAAVRSVRAKR